MPKFCANLTWLFTELPFLQRFGAAKDAGFDGIELNYDLDSDLSPKSGTKDFTAIRQMADEIGIAISGLCSFLFWPYPLTSNDPTERRGTLVPAPTWASGNSLAIASRQSSAASVRSTTSSTSSPPSSKASEIFSAVTGSSDCTSGTTRLALRDCRSFVIIVS